ncbi:trypsin-like serine protease [Kribbella sp. NPDC051587]|uniref:trypsin-like serine protease n=1 Tax=Kribbella sp. NPDC051587 TaxID=3364119 RepID=UPI00379D2E37
MFGAQSCAATLVSSIELVTAAHCVRTRRPASLDVVIGADNLCSTAPITGERIQISAIHIDPDPRLDRATLTTLHPATTPPILTKPVPTQPAATGDLVAVGWGRDTRVGPSPCRKRAVPLVSATPAACRRAQVANPNRWHPAQLCATAAPGATRNTCTGDSGGPVIATKPGTPPELVAITIWGIGCAPDQVGFYSPASGN